MTTLLEFIIIIISIIKHLFNLVKGTILKLVLEHAVHNYFAINLLRIHTHTHTHTHTHIYICTLHNIETLVGDKE
jgi:hypothetical protein